MTTNDTIFKVSFCIVERWSRSHQFIGTQKLSEMLQQPYDLFKAGWADQYLMGMVNQVAQAMDDSVTNQVDGYWIEQEL